MDELQIVYTTEAMQDILGISDYYFDKVGESAALRAVDALQNNIDKLMRFPRMGEEHPDEYLKVLNFCKLAHCCFSKRMRKFFRKNETQIASVSWTPAR